MLSSAKSDHWKIILYLGIYGQKFSLMATVKHDFIPYIRQYTFLNENFEYGHPNSNALLQSHLKLECWEPHKAACQPMNDCDDIPEEFFEKVDYEKNQLTTKKAWKDSQGTKSLFWPYHKMHS